MQYSKLAATIGVAFLFCGGSLSLAGQSPGPAPQAPGSMTQVPSATAHGHGGEGLRQFLTPEQRAVWKLDHKAEMKSLTPEQRHAYKRQLKEQFLAMTPEQRAKMRDGLQAEWGKLSSDRQQRIEQRIAMHDQHRLARHNGALPQSPGRSPAEVAPPQAPANPPTNQL